MKNLKSAAIVLSALPATLATLSIADAVINYGARNDACTAKIAQLTQDFYARAPQGQQPLLQNVSLNKGEIPTLFNQSAFLIKPKECFPPIEKTSRFTLS